MSNTLRPLGPDYDEDLSSNDGDPVWVPSAPTPSEDIPVAERITNRLYTSGARFWANDNIADFILDGEKQELIEDLTGRFQQVLRGLVIDVDTDPNSHGTAKRLAKMYVNELMSGRYDKAPPVTAFPNTDPNDRYDGILVTQAEIKSMCSHHHQPVTGMCYIGLIPSIEVIGLSKYARLAQHLARRGTLQEELTKKIAETIMLHTHSKDVAVILNCSHGCCENRGIMAKNSNTVTSIMNGQFFNPSVKNEFLTLVGLSRRDIM